MFIGIIILVFLCFGCNGMDPQFRYDYKYYKEADGWLKLHYVPMHWAAARLQCYYEGAVLVSPLDTFLGVAITRVRRDRKPCPNVIFSGVSALFAQGIYTSIEGVPLERMSIYWSLNEPAHSDGCLVFYSNGTMGSKSCRDSYPFICYKKDEGLIINECGTVDNEYQRLNNETTKCYKYHPEPADWSTAYKICMAEGAHLATTFDYEDQLEHKQTNGLVIAVGFKHVSGDWWDVYGNVMVDPPKRGGSYLDCGGRQKDGTLISIYCSEKHPFLCEKTVDSLLPNEKENASPSSIINLS